MPEGPELHLATKFVNACCEGRVFAGKIVKNPVHKSSHVEFESSASAYSIAAASRGKEMQLILTKLDSSNGNKQSARKNDKKLNIPETLRILFRFGMSGNFQFTTPEDIHKHAHLKFFTKDKPQSQMVLSYVDIRRFGRWEVGADWSKDRGPDPMFEYQAFRSNVVNSLKNAAFNYPICETMLNQKYFNGIGNYLRAEILYRLRIPPFEKARTVLEGLSEEPPDVKPKKGGGQKGEEPDLLHLCNAVPLEVIAIGAGGYTADGKAADYSDFMKWVQCYYQDGMNNMVDHNKRTIWFTGPTGPMVPKEEKSRKIKSVKKRKTSEGAGDAGTQVKVQKEEAQSEIIKESSKTSSRKQKQAKTSTIATSTKKSTPASKRKVASKKGKANTIEKAASRPSQKTKKGKGSAAARGEKGEGTGKGKAVGKTPSKKGASKGVEKKAKGKGGGDGDRGTRAKKRVGRS